MHEKLQRLRETGGATHSNSFFDKSTSIGASNSMGLTGGAYKHDNKGAAAAEEDDEGDQMFERDHSDQNAF